MRPRLTMRPWSDPEREGSPPWRALLPEPHAAVVGWSGSESLRDGAARFCASVRPLPDLGSNEADGVVLATDSVEVLEQAAAALKPGGWVYVETEATWMVRPARMRRRLARAGFALTEMFAVSPARDRDGITWWIPMGRGVAADFVARELSFRRRRSRRRRLVATGIRIVGRVAPRVLARHPWLLQPQRKRCVRAVATKADAGSVPPRSVMDWVHGNGSTPGGDGDSAGAVLVRTGGTSTHHPIAFLLDPDRSDPMAVVKMPTLPSELEDMDDEARNLDALRACGLSARSGVPGLLFCRRSGDIGALGMGFVAGAPAASTAAPADVASIAVAATDWLSTLASRTAASTEGAAWDTVRAALDRLVRHWPDGSPPSDLLSSAERRLVGLACDVDVMRHRDFGPWNVHVGSEGEIGVVDWTIARPGPPMLDLVHFLTHLVFCAEDAYGSERLPFLFQETLDPGTERGRLVSDCLSRYAGAVGIDSDDIPRLRTLNWVLCLAEKPAHHWSPSLYLDLLRMEVSR